MARKVVGGVGSVVVVVISVGGFGIGMVDAVGLRFRGKDRGERREGILEAGREACLAGLV